MSVAGTRACARPGMDEAPPRRTRHRSQGHSSVGTLSNEEARAHAIPRRIAALIGATAIVLAACSGSATPSAGRTRRAGRSTATEPSRRRRRNPVTINWWHITTDKLGKPDFQSIADAYTEDHPNVTIKITVLENEAFKAKLDGDGSRTTIRTCSSRGAAAAWPRRLRRAYSRTSRRCRD